MDSLPEKLATVLQKFLRNLVGRATVAGRAMFDAARVGTRLFFGGLCRTGSG